jgi:NAD(P)H-hydrate epimerase
MHGIAQAGEALHTAAEVRTLDRIAIDTGGIPGTVLMARAGRAAFALLQRLWPQVQSLDVVCGIGNNGGDGFVVAQLARERGLRVRVLLCGDTGRISGEARAALDALMAAGVAPGPFDPALGVQGEVVVDALLGTGLGGPVRAAQAQAIGWMNASGRPVLALDIPSGLCSDTGNPLGTAVRASHTLSFIGRKRGLHTGVAADLAGERHFDALGVPAPLLQSVPAGARLLRCADLLPVLPARGRAAHKGHFGHVLVLGGNTGMAGAAALAGMAAARAGAGLVSVAVRPGNEGAVLAACPELMVRAVAYTADLAPMLARASVLLVGPGLGRDAWAQQLLTAALASALPTVIDADALNALADGSIDTRAARPERWVLTPHPGEAARLLGTDTASVGADRFAALAQLLGRYPGAVVLKGAGTLVADAGSGLPVMVCAEGNPGMASGGMGDVLGGLIAALLAQGLEPALAARLGVLVHARAADLAAGAEGERGLLASDLLPRIRQLLNGRGAA